jgi:hypothetical protein
LLTVGAGEIAEVNIESGGFVVGIGLQLLNADGESAEEEVAGVGHDGAATRGDTIFGEKEKQAGEELVYVMGALKLGEFAGENGAQVSGMQELGLFRGMAETEARARVDDAEAAALAGDGAMLTTS